MRHAFDPHRVRTHLTRILERIAGPLLLALAGWIAFRVWLNFQPREMEVSVAPGITLLLQALPNHQVDGEGVNLRASNWSHRLVHKMIVVDHYQCADFAPPNIHRGSGLVALTYGQGCDHDRIVVRTTQGEWKVFLFQEGRYASYRGWRETPPPPSWPVSLIKSVDLDKRQVLVERGGWARPQLITFGLSESGTEMVVLEDHFECSEIEKELTSQCRFNSPFR